MTHVYVEGIIESKSYGIDYVDFSVSSYSEFLKYTSSVRCVAPTHFKDKINTGEKVGVVGDYVSNHNTHALEDWVAVRSIEQSVEEQVTDEFLLNGAL
jgi:hypothetical protein